MELSAKLLAQGWHLTEEGIKTLVTAVGSEDPRKIIDEALNRDLRDIGGGALPNKREDPTLPGRIVLQVQRVRNISAPKANEESKAAPRLLQVDLSDGQSSIQALELESVPALNLNVAPGSKIYFRSDKLQLVQGFLLLCGNELQLLGGRVDALYEKWDLARTMLKYARSGRPLSGTTAPPPWVAFGKKVDTTADRNFKSLIAGGDKDKPSKENDEFNAMRNEAIALASKAAVKKVFGGGGQNLVDHNIKKILDKGYSEEEANSALHATRNNLERALYNLKRRKEAGGYTDAPPTRGGRGERTGREGGKRGASLKDEVEAAKPAANATLFDFLTTKLPATEVVTTPAPTAPLTTYTANNTSKMFNARSTESERRSSTAANVANNKSQGLSDRSRFENNISSSFAAHRGSRGGGSTRGGGRGRGGRDERPTRDDRERPYTERNAASSRKQENTNQQSNRSQSNRNANDQAGHKAAAESKTEQEPTASKESFNNRRNNERQSGRGGTPRAENGNVSNNRRRQQDRSNGAKSGNVNNTNNNNNEEFNARLNKVVEETANLKLGGAKREDKRGGGRQGSGYMRQPNAENVQQQNVVQAQKTERAVAAQRQHQQKQQQNSSRQKSANSSAANYSQLPNGYTYDPSKIMGFQSKETNEFAMSLLKSQGVDIAADAEPEEQQQQQPANNYSAAPTLSNFLLSNPEPTVMQPPPQQFGIMPGDWFWKQGDFCMAKYWDDGRYYEAEITAVADKTCVVFFLGYGNHEEVLKTDILPITDEQNRPLTNMPQQQQPNRYRGDRQGQQMYVPPHKREH